MEEEKIIKTLKTLIRVNEGNQVACRQFKAPDYFYDLLELEKNVFKYAIKGIGKVNQSESHKMCKAVIDFIEGDHHKVFKEHLDKFLFENSHFN